MKRKFIAEGPDKKGKTDIILVDEDKATSTRKVVKFICEVSNQETQEETEKITSLLLDSLNTEITVKQSKLGTFDPKFENGIPVVVKNQFVAIVFSSYNLFTDKRNIIYNVVANASELAHRVRNNRSQDFECESDKDLFSEDYNDLLFSEKQICLLEVGEDELRAY